MTEVQPRPKDQPYVIGDEHILTALQIGYCPKHDTLYISDNCVICTKPWEEK